jgi:hypothetical protein
VDGTLQGEYIRREEEQPMTITPQLKPEVQVRLFAFARAQSASLEIYLAGVIEAQVLSGPKRRPTLEKFKADLEAIAEGINDVPVLPPGALTREAIYGNH